MVQKFTRCARCNEVIPLLPEFGAGSLPGVEWSAKDIAHRKRFLRLHLGHPLEELSLIPATLISNRPAGEPCGISYFEASNGKRRFLIKRLKKGFGCPARYAIVPGRLKFSPPSLDIQENDLRRQIFSENGYFPLSRDKVEKFIQAMRREVENLSAGEIRVAGEESPLLAYGNLKRVHWEKVLRRCRKDLPRRDLAAPTMCSPC